MTGLFVGLLTETQLLEIIETARKDIAAGRAITSYTAAGISVTKEHSATLPPRDVMLEARYALQCLKPEVYGRSLRTKRTVAQFS